MTVAAFTATIVPLLEEGDRLDLDRARPTAAPATSTVERAGGVVARVLRVDLVHRLEVAEVDRGRRSS